MKLGLWKKKTDGTEEIAVNTSRKKKSRVESIHRHEILPLWLMALPGIVLIFLFHYVPMGGLVISFKNYIPIKGIWGSEWNGLENFKLFFTTLDCVRTIRNTVLYSLTFLFLDVICALGVAVLIYNLIGDKAKKIYQTVIILPRFMSAVLIAYIVYGLLAPSGVVNGIITALGGERIMFYQEPAYWPFVLTIVHVWGSVGMSSVTYLAALMSLDSTLVEAARVDGANRWQVTWNVYIPHLYPMISIVMLLALGGIFSSDFGLFYQIPMDKGVLYPTTDTIATYVYRGLTAGNLGISAAIGLVQSAVGCAMVVLSNAVVRKISPENSLF